MGAADGGARAQHAARGVVPALRRVGAWCSAGATTLRGQVAFDAEGGASTRDAARRRRSTARRHQTESTTRPMLPGSRGTCSRLQRAGIAARFRNTLGATGAIGARGAQLRPRRRGPDRRLFRNAAWPGAGRRPWPRPRCTPTQRVPPSDGGIAGPGRRAACRWEDVTMSLGVPVRAFHVKSRDLPTLVDFAGTQAGEYGSTSTRPAVGDYILNHVGYAISRIPEDDRRRARHCMKSCCAAMRRRPDERGCARRAWPTNQKGVAISYSTVPRPRAGQLAAGRRATLRGTRPGTSWRSAAGRPQRSPASGHPRGLAQGPGR